MNKKELDFNPGSFYCRGDHAFSMTTISLKHNMLSNDNSSTV